MSQRTAENTRWGVGGGAVAWLVQSWNKLKSYIELELDGALTQIFTDPHAYIILKYGVESLWTAFIGGALIAVARDRKSQPDPIQVRPPGVVQTPVVAPVPPPVIRSSVIDMQKLRQELERDEGVRYEIYNDTRNLKTAGIGHLLTRQDPEYNEPVGTPVSEQRVQDWFSQDVSKAIADARALVPNLESHPSAVVHALINMAFNLGRTRLSKFKKTLSLINSRQYEEASLEALNSRWASQVGRRANRISVALANADNINLA